MKKAIRMKIYSYITDEEFNKNLATIVKNLDVIDEITLFVDATHHGYTPLNKIAENAALVTRRISQFKEAGVGAVGINVLCTLGHTEDGNDICEKADLQYMQALDGTPSHSCLCPSDNRVTEYITHKYRLFAGTGADYIWMDDDVRLGNHGAVRDLCFCPSCIKNYNEAHGTDYDIDYIRAHWDGDAKLRNSWHEMASATLSKLVNAISSTVFGVSPKIELGYMSGGNNYVYEWIDSSRAVKGRPGGGFYNERTPIDVFGKAFWIQLELTQYPERVTDIQYEYETFNFRTLEKSRHISELETTLSLMVGCNGVLYNRAFWHDDQPFFDMLRASNKKWQTIERINRGCHNIGVWCASALSGKELSEISIPVCASLEYAQTAFVQGEEWNSLDDAQIEAVLNKNVITDGRGLELLAERGYPHDWCAVIEKSYHNGVIEQLAEHGFNEEYKGVIRHVSMDLYYEGDAYQLCASKDAQVLSHFRTVDQILGTSMCMAEHDGRRFVADGCLMAGQLQTASKRRQLMNVFDWLSRGTLPVIIREQHKIVPIVTGRDVMTENVFLCNASFDATKELTVEIRSPKTFYVVTDNGELVVAKQSHKNGTAFVTLPSIPAWSYIIITSNI